MANTARIILLPTAAADPVIQYPHCGRLPGSIASLNQARKNKRRNHQGLLEKLRAERMAEARLRRIDALRNAIIEFDSLSGVESGFADAARGARRQLEVALYDQAAYESQNRSKQE